MRNSRLLWITVILSLASHLHAGAKPFSDSFDGSSLSNTDWSRGGTNKPLQTVRDGSLRLVSAGKMNSSQVVSRRSDFNFFKSPVSVVWDIVPERTLVGPHPNTRNSKAYAGLALGAARGTAAELALATWPEGYPIPEENAKWYYTLDLGTLLPANPKGELRLSGAPRRIIWTLDKESMTVEIKGARFEKGDKSKRTVAHGLKPEDFGNRFHLKIFTSSHETSMEPGANHLSGVVYTDQISINTVPPYSRSKTTPIPTYAEMLKRLTGKGIPKSSPAQYVFGVNYAGGNFRKDTFRAATPESLDYFRSRGILLMRLPIKWSRIQPKLMGDLEPRYLGNVKKTVSLMAARKMQVIIDLHDYGQYKHKVVIGSNAVPYKAFSDIWRRLALEFKDHECIWGYGLMNEPVFIMKTWGKAAQAGVDGIRAVDKKTPIVVSGHRGGGPVNWERDNRTIFQDVVDPQNNLCYEAHCYFDYNCSGKYNHSYEYEINRPDARVHPRVAEERFRSFINWLKRHKRKGLLGELAVPSNPDRDPRWLEIMDNAYECLRKNSVPSTYWAAGTLWTRQRCYVIEPFKGVDRPQTTILLKHANKAAR